MLKKSLIGALAVFMSAGLLSACAEEKTEEPQMAVNEMPGPAIGTMAPLDFDVKNSKDEAIKTLSLTGEKGMVLVFNRSVSWCPVCQGQLVGLNDIADDIKAKGYNLVSLTYDKVEAQNKFVADKKLVFPLISDQEFKVIDAFGIRDPQYTEGVAVGVPYASIFVLSPEGEVLKKSVSSDYKLRPSNEEVMMFLNELESDITQAG